MRRARGVFFAARRAGFFLAATFLRAAVVLRPPVVRGVARVFFAARFFLAVPVARFAAGRVRCEAPGAAVTGRATGGAGGCEGIGVAGSISGGMGDGISMSPSISLRRGAALRCIAAPARASGNFVQAAAGPRTRAAWALSAALDHTVTVDRARIERTCVRGILTGGAAVTGFG